MENALLPFTLFYSIYMGKGHSVPGVCRVQAPTEEIAVSRCEKELGGVFAVLAGHPRLLSHPESAIRLFKWIE